MGGFKNGSVNGWDDDAADDPDLESNRRSDDSGPDATDSGAVSADAGSGDDEASGGGTARTSDIPWVLRRNSITDGREQTVQLHLQAGTMDVQRTQKSVIEDQLGESVRKADLREAALLVGLQRADDVVEVLEEWGYALD